MNLSNHQMEHGAWSMANPVSAVRQSLGWNPYLVGQRVVQVSLPASVSCPTILNQARGMCNVIDNCGTLVRWIIVRRRIDTNFWRDLYCWGRDEAQLR